MFFTSLTTDRVSFGLDSVGDIKLCELLDSWSDAYESRRTIYDHVPATFIANWMYMINSTESE